MRRERRFGRPSVVLVLVALVALLALPADALTPAPPAASLPWGTPPPSDVVPGAALSTISRDCAFSVELSDGAALWIYCDSTDHVAGGSLTYFVNSTAALALPSAPLQMHEPATTGGGAHQFIPAPASNPCLPSERNVLWPISATRVPHSAPLDRVVVWFESICQDTTTYANRSLATGVADWFYDPTQPLASRVAGPFVATVRNAALWPRTAGNLWGSGAVDGGDGFAYVMRCWNGDCDIARAPYAQVHQVGSYTYWNGSTWVATEQSGKAATFLAGGPFAVNHVVWIDDMALFAMSASSPESPNVVVWFAHRPEGPWGPPVTIPFPGCDLKPNPFVSACYHGTIHSQLSGRDHLAVGLHDAVRVRPHGTASANVVSQVRVDFDPPLPGTCRTVFRDVWHAHPFCTQIRWGAEQGLLGGYDDGSFRPPLPVSRQAMASFLWRLAGQPAVPDGAPTFPDVPSGHQFEVPIRWLAGAGYATGYADGTFRPGARVSRQATASFLWKMAGQPPLPPAAPTFSDVPPDHQFAPAIRWLAAVGVTTGYGDGTFLPARDVSRQAMAAFLQRYATR